MKRIIRILSLLLIFAMLLPMTVACAGDPSSENPEGEGGGQNPPENTEGKFVTVKQTGTDTLTLFDTANTIIPSSAVSPTPSI